MKKVTLLGFICLALMLTVMSFAACAQQTPPAASTVAAPPVTVTVTATPTQQMFSVLDPRGVEPERPIFALNPRLDTLDGKTVNVINWHGGNEAAMASVPADLKAAVPKCNVVYVFTDGGFGGGPLTTDDWAKMTKCDAAIVGHNF